MPEGLRELEVRLLRAGVHPSRARRYVAELHDHAQDAADELEAKGVPRAEALRRAFSALGSMDTLAQLFEQETRFLSWAAKAPWLVYLLMPIAVSVAAVGSMIGFLISQTGGDTLPSWFSFGAMLTGYASGGIITTLAAWSITAIAFRQRSRWGWPLLGGAVCVAFGAAFDFAVIVAPGADTGEMVLGLSLPGMPSLLALAVIAAVPALVLWVRVRRLA